MPLSEEFGKQAVIQLIDEQDGTVVVDIDGGAVRLVEMLVSAMKADSDFVIVVCGAASIYLEGEGQSLDDWQVCLREFVSLNKRKTT